MVLYLEIRGELIMIPLNEELDIDFIKEDKFFNYGEMVEIYFDCLLPTFVEDKLNDEYFKVQSFDILTILNSLIHPFDEVAVTFVIHHEKTKYRKLNLNKYFKNIYLTRNKFYVENIVPDPESNRINVIESFTYECQKNEIRLLYLINSIINVGYKRKPSVDNKYIYHTNVYIWNKSDDTIIYIYDNGGAFIRFKNEKDANTFRNLYPNHYK